MADRGGTAELSTAEDTIALGASLGRSLRAGDVVVLSGPLGAGKTVLAKGIAQAMDVAGASLAGLHQAAGTQRQADDEAGRMAGEAVGV